MVEGGSSKDFICVKGLLYDQPKLLHQLLEVTARAVTAYLNAQTAAGAQALMVFDTWGGILSPRAYREFSLEYMARIVAGLNLSLIHIFINMTAIATVDAQEYALHQRSI